MNIMSSTTLPAAIIPFILANIDGFDITLEGSERIVLTPKKGATINPETAGQLATAVLQGSVAPRADGRVPAVKVSAPPRSILRPKFIYRVADKKLTPDTAKKYGWTPPRVAVYKVIFEHPKGVQSKTVMEKTGLQHGSVQQILNWLRKQELIVGEPETH